MQEISTGGGGGGGLTAGCDPAADHLFASSPMPLESCKFRSFDLQRKREGEGGMASIFGLSLSFEMKCTKREMNKGVQIYVSVCRRSGHFQATVLELPIFSLILSGTYSSKSFTCTWQL
ncbi:hypothetical protein CsSME_00008447 [Camellia sinensis var. sinensis]